MLTFRSALVLLCLAQPALAVDGAFSGAARVVDGDTIEVAGVMVRLYGIDAPEKAQTCAGPQGEWACGAWAGRQLSAAIAGQGVTCHPQDRDRYGRTVAICLAGGADLGALQVEAGAAEAYRRYSTRHVAAEGAARARGLGIWGGAMQHPEAFRAAANPAPANPAPSDLAPAAAAACAIKGNISANGRIYHRPGQHDYAATRIDPRKGEAWFCTEAEARAAGFRPARR